MTLLTAEEKELLEKATSLMDELLETLEVMQDNELVKDLRAALREIEMGKTRPLDELIRELDLEGKVWSYVYSQLLKENQSFRHGSSSADNSRN